MALHGAARVHGSARAFGSRDAPARLRNDTDVAAVAVAQHGRALQFASARLQNDKDVVSVAVAQNGNALARASTELQNDKDVVSIAVAQNDRALRFASTELQNDMDVVAVAVVQDDYALEYSSVVALQGLAKLQHHAATVTAVVKPAGQVGISGPVGGRAQVRWRQAAAFAAMQARAEAAEAESVHFRAELAKRTGHH